MSQDSARNRQEVPDLSSREQPCDLPDLIENYLSLIEDQEYAYSFGYGACIAGLSALVGRRVSWRGHYPVVYTCLTGLSGRSRKTTAIRQMQEFVLNELVEQYFPASAKPTLTVLQGTGTGEGIIQAVATDPADKSGRTVLVISDEFSGQLEKIDRGQAGALKDLVILRGFDCPPRIENRTKVDPITAVKPTIVFLTATTKAGLSKVLTPTLVREGVVSRFLYLEGQLRRTNPSPPPPSEIALEEHRNKWRKILDMVLGRENGKVPLPFLSAPTGRSQGWDGQMEIAPEAWSLYERLYKQHMESAADDGELNSREPEIAVRLSILHALARCCQVISYDDMLLGWWFARRSTVSIAEIVSHGQPDPTEQKVLRAIHRISAKQGPFKLKDILKSAHLPSKDVVPVIRNLVTMGSISECRDNPGFFVLDEPHAGSDLGETLQ